MQLSDLSSDVVSTRFMIEGRRRTFHAFSHQLLCFCLKSTIMLFFYWFKQKGCSWQSSFDDHLSNIILHRHNWWFTTTTDVITTFFSRTQQKWLLISILYPHFFCCLLYIPDSVAIHFLLFCSFKILVSFLQDPVKLCIQGLYFYGSPSSWNITMCVFHSQSVFNQQLVLLNWLSREIAFERGDHLKKNEGGSKCEEKYDKTDRKDFVPCLTFIYTFDLIFQVHEESEGRRE